MSTTITIKQIQDDTWNEAIDAAIQRVRAGRTILRATGDGVAAALREKYGVKP